ncbi:MAG: pantoate--beta-alanine ligase [Deltaproteobacteria bacterium]|nr:pantoate--beta-alanine ligase [Deltaproteobacteria bacterium]
MIILKLPEEVQHWALNTKRRGQRIAFVPTMGALHEGHLSLLREGRRLGDKLAMSIFVNPLQFGPAEDFEKYPRDEPGDLKKAQTCGVDVIFAPSAKDIYPGGFQTAVAVQQLSMPLCGAGRPGHFQGVATVVLKLFNIVQPDIALFGEKDYQQLKVIQKMVRDLNLPIQIKPMPFVREKDGLAMSSRNTHLSPEERKAALAIPTALQKAKGLATAGETDPKTILNAVVATLTESKKIAIDYVSLCDPETLEELKVLQRPALLAIACFVGKTRLIDNCLLK